MTNIRRPISHIDHLEAALRWAVEYYARPALDVARATRGSSQNVRRELWRLSQADALLTEGGAFGSVTQPKEI